MPPKRRFQISKSRNASPAPSRPPSPVHQSASAVTQKAGNRLNLAPPNTGSKVKEVARVAWEGLKTSLVLLNESSGCLPPLKAAVGGLVALIDAIELVSNNVADLESLRQKIDGLTSIIKENSQDGTFPWLRRRLSDFAEKLNETVEIINSKSNQGRLRRFAEGKRDKKDIAGFAGAISDLVTNLQSDLTLYTSRVIKRLLSNKSLKKLKASEMARYDAPLTKHVQRRGCTLNTRKKILEDLMKWAKDPDSPRMYWMNGMAGTGKTTIAYSFCEQLQEKGLLGANFFCSRSLAECSDIQYIIPTTTRQLALSCPQFAPALLEVLEGDFQMPSFRNQFKRLLLEPFQSISESITDTLIIVIDALDECNNGASEIRLFLKLIFDCFVAKIIPLKVFLTSRPEDVISRSIIPAKPSSPSKWSVVHIHDIEKSLVQADIKVYVEDELAEIAETWELEDGWPPSTEVDVVVGNANRLFIYAATAIRYVKEDSGNPRMRLSEMASTSRVGKDTSERSSLTTELIDGLYKTLLERALDRLNQVENKLVRMVLKLIVCAQTPLTLDGIASLVRALGEFKHEIQTSCVRTALKLLHSVISIPMGGDGVVTPFHASFPDFLFDSHRCGSINYIPFRESHQDIARMCLLFMDKFLTVDNITGSDRWQTVDAIIQQEKIEKWIPSALAYACMFWASHIDANDEIESLSTELDGFLTHQVLRWLEVLSLLRRLDIGVEILARMKGNGHPTLSCKFDDVHKFLKDVFDIINVWPSEVFHSGLVWAPEQSFIRKTYLKTSAVRIVCGHRADWGTCELTIRGHSGCVNSVAVSPDNRHVVSGSGDRTVRIWNLSTGEEEHVLRHPYYVGSVAVSPDNSRVVSGSGDSTVRIWNASTGEEEHVLHGHSDWVKSVAVSPDNRHVVSGSSDKTVRIWNLSTGEEEHVLQGHSDWVTSNAVSPDQVHVVSGSWDGTVRIWNALTGGEEHVLRGHSGSVNTVAISPDNRHIVLGSFDHIIRVFNASTGEEEHVLRHSESHVVQSVAVSPDNRHIVSGSSDNIVRIWNMSTGAEEHVLRGHSQSVQSVAVSPDNRHIVSGSSDGTVRIWNVSTGGEEHVLQEHSRSVQSVALSPDNRHIVSGSSDNTVRIWNASTGEEEHVLRGHSERVPVDSVVFSPDNRHVVSGSWDKTVRIWNALTGEEEHVLNGHSDVVYSVAVSPDNCHVVSGSWDSTVRIWNASTGEEEHILNGHSDFVYSVVVSPDNNHVVSGSRDTTVRIWNTSTGKEEHVLQGHSAPVHSVAVSPDNCHVVSGSYDNTVRFWNASTGEEEPPFVISFVVSSDNFHVMSGSQVDAIPVEKIFLSSMVLSIAHFAQGDNTMSIPVIQKLASGESLQLDILLQALSNGLSPVPMTFTPDGLSILFSNGKKCLAIPSTLRNIRSAGFSRSRAYFGHGSGQVTILDIST